MSYLSDVQELVEKEQEQEQEPPVSESVCAAVLPEEDMHDVDQALDKAYVMYGHYFRSREDCNYFNMLPVNDKVKKAVLRRAVELEQEKKNE